MERQTSTIIISTRPKIIAMQGHERITSGMEYVATVRGHFGGGYSGAHAGNTAEEAALFALREKARYIDNNPLGGDLFAPEDVRAAMQAAKL